MAASEIEIKTRRLTEFLERYRLDGVLLTGRANFAWATAGRDNRFAGNENAGVAGILATKTERICLADSVEAPRMEVEEMTGMGMKTVPFPWWDRSAAHKVIRDIVASRRIAADVDPLELGLAALPPAFTELRWNLTDAEIMRYREGARRTVAAVQSAARDIKPGISEHDGMGILEHHLRRQGLEPVRTVVAGDDRIERFRWPGPTDKRIQRLAMLSVSAGFRGLTSSVTRMVSFGKLTDEFRKKQQAAANVDTAAILSSKSGQTLAEVFGVMERAYEENGFGGQWKLADQGGVTGYAIREVLARPDCTVTIKENQAMTWRAAIAGAHSEDTILVTSRGSEILTAIQGDWPKLIGQFKGPTLARADVLVV